DHVEINNQAVLEVGKDNADFALAFWVKLKTGNDGNWRLVTHKGNDTGERTFAMWLHPDSNKVHYRISTTGSWNDGGDSTNALPLNTWTHIAYVKEKDKLKLYINGVKDSEKKLQGDTISNDGPIYIGTRPNSTGADMDIDEYKVFDTKLTKDEVLSIYDNENSGKSWNGAERTKILCGGPRDFGDAPYNYTDVSHTISDNLYLGDTKPDNETEQQSSSNADGDNIKDENDEDGVVSLNPLYRLSNVYTISVKVNNSTGEDAYVTAWIDFNNNGTFEYNEAINSDKVIVPSATNAQIVNIQWDNSFSPSMFNPTIDSAIMRVRVSTSQVLREDDAYYKNGSNFQSDYFVSPDGEVEDYKIEIKDKPNDNSFECNNDGHIFNSPVYTDPFTDGYIMKLEDKTFNFNTRFGNRHINAAGYNVNDNFIYGIGEKIGRFGRFEIVKIDKDYNVEVLPINGLVQGQMGYSHGDVSFDNRYYISTLWDKFGNFHYLQELTVINLITQEIEESVSLVYPAGTEQIYSADYAFNPKDGMLYTVNALNNHLVRIHPKTGLVTDLGYVGTSKSLYSVVSFFDIDGQYFFTDEAGSILYSIDISNPSSVDPTVKVYASGLNIPGSGDGAKCAYSRVEQNRPVAEYRLDACSWSGIPNEVIDSSGNNFHGVAHNDANSVSEAKIGRAGSFDGEGKAIYIDDNPQLNPETLTVSAWVNPDNLTDWDSVVSKSSNGNWDDGWGMATYKEHDKINFYINNYSKNKATATLPSGWSHVVGTYDGQNIKIYINGILKDTQAYSKEIDHSKSKLSIGRNSGDSYSWKGEIDEVKLFDSVLEDYQIFNIFSNETMGKNWDGTTRVLPDCSPYVVSAENIAQLEGSDGGITPATMTVTLNKPAPEGGLVLGYETIDGTAYNEDYVESSDMKDGLLDGNAGAGDNDTSSLDGYDATNPDHIDYKIYWDNWLIFIFSYWKYESYYSEQYSSYRDYYINELGMTPKDSGTQKQTRTVTKSSKGSTNLQKSKSGTTQQKTGDSSSTPNPNDYYKKQGILTIVEGEKSGTIDLDIVADTKDEVDETFYLNLTPMNINLDQVTLKNPSPSITIIDDDEANKVETIAEFRFDDCGNDEWRKDFSPTANDATGTAKIIQDDFKTYMCNSVENSNWDIAIPDNKAYDITEGTISILLYDNHTVWDKARLISKGWNWTERLYLEIENVAGDEKKGSIRAYLNGQEIKTDETYFTTRDDGTDSDTQWTHVTFSFGSEGMKLYINGVLKGTNSYTGGIDG
ncbi:MAG: hypothetical protein K0U38_04905, partial [Epsilonproteobacteria bacterium]|nr:hypothetical protein [Campylobacterota bacterium]